MTLAPPIPLKCNGMCQVTFSHPSHLFVMGRQYPLWSNRKQATVLLPDGTRLTRSNPDGIRALKLDVQLYFERLAEAAS